MVQSIWQTVNFAVNEAKQSLCICVGDFTSIKPIIFPSRVNRVSCHKVVVSRITLVLTVKTIEVVSYICDFKLACGQYVGVLPFYNFLTAANIEIANQQFVVSHIDFAVHVHIADCNLLDVSITNVNTIVNGNIRVEFIITNVNVSRDFIFWDFVSVFVYTNYGSTCTIAIINRSFILNPNRNVSVTRNLEEVIGFQCYSLSDFRCKVYILNLVAPSQLNVITSIIQHIPVRSFCLKYRILAKRKRDTYFTNCTIMNDRQEVIGCWRTSWSKHNSICCAITTYNGGDNISLGIPQSAVSVCILLIILSNDVFGSDNLELSTRQRTFLIGELASSLIKTSQNFTSFLDVDTTNGFVVPVFFFNNKVIGIVFVQVTSCIPNAVGCNLKVNVVVTSAVNTVFILVKKNTVFAILSSVSPLVVEAFWSLYLNNTVVTDFELLRQSNISFSIGVERVNFLNSRAIQRGGHSNQTRVALLIQDIVSVVVHPIQLECRTFTHNILASFNILLIDAQVGIHNLVVNNVAVIHEATSRRGGRTLDVTKARDRNQTFICRNIKDNGVCLHTVFRNSSFNQNILTIRKTKDAKVASII